MDVNLDFAKDNKSELTKVLDHYLLSDDTLKQQCVIFLLSNMCSHFSVYNADTEKIKMQKCKRSENKSRKKAKSFSSYLIICPFLFTRNEV